MLPGIISAAIVNLNGLIARGRPAIATADDRAGMSRTGRARGTPTRRSFRDSVAMVMAAPESAGPGVRAEW